MTRPSFKDIDHYINSFEEPVKSRLEEMREIFRKAAPKAEETISYAIPTFKINGKFIGYFAGFKNHVSFYPIPRLDEQTEKEISPYVRGKGTLQFQLDKRLPKELITKLVHSWIKQRSEADSY